jgi:hypothetical protein
VSRPKRVARDFILHRHTTTGSVSTSRAAPGARPDPPPRAASSRAAHPKASGGAVGGSGGWLQSGTLRSRSAFVMTETELKLIAAAATMGDKSSPKAG